MANLKLSVTGPLTHWPTDSPNYKEMLSHLKNIIKGWWTYPHPLTNEDDFFTHRALHRWDIQELQASDFFQMNCSSDFLYNIFIGDKIKYGICSASHLAGSIGISTRLWWTNNSKSGDVNCQSLYFFWCKSQYITFCCPSQPHWIERFKKTKEVWGCNLTSICHCVAIIGLIIRGVNLEQSRGEITQIMVWSATK